VLGDNVGLLRTALVLRLGLLGLDDSAGLGLGHS